MQLSLKDTNILKGIAIMLMLCHHAFFRPYNGYMDVDIHGHGLVNTFALMCKVCVSIFVFISGYGLSEKYKEGEYINIKRFYWNRFVKLFANYWLVWLIFVPMSALCFGPSVTDQYGNNHIVIKMFLDFLGIINLFDRYPYNPTWWFYSCIIGLYLLFPVFHSLSRKSFLYVVGIGIAIYFLPTSYMMCVRLYMLTFILGILYSRFHFSGAVSHTPPPMGMDVSARHPVLMPYKGWRCHIIRFHNRSCRNPHLSDMSVE